MAVSAFSLGECQKYDIDNLAPVLTDAKPVCWRALITSDVNFHVAAGHAPVATTGSLRVPVSTKAPFVLNIGAGERLSLLGADAGSVWVTEVR